MIGFYVHHHGDGHRRRCSAIARALGGDEVVGLGTGAAPRSWPGAWCSLPPDDDAAVPDPTANGVLHWAPRTAGVRSRAGAMAAAIARYEPTVVVVDVSVEAALLVRLHGVPVVAVAQPGTRDDPAHSLGQQIASSVIAPWPAWAGDRPWRPATGVSAIGVGPIAGTAGTTARTPAGSGVTSQRVDGRRDADAVAVMVGRGGHRLTASWLASLARRRPARSFHLLGDLPRVREPNIVHHGWVDDVDDRLGLVGVVLTHAGQTAVATVARARVPAVVVPQPRPFDEQMGLARVLHEERLATVVDAGATPAEVAAALDLSRDRGGTAWVRWDDGGGAQRAATVVRRVAEESG